MTAVNFFWQSHIILIGLDVNIDFFTDYYIVSRPICSVSGVSLAHLQYTTVCLCILLSLQVIAFQKYLS